MTWDVNAIPLALYVHWPWCIQKCPYCDFNSHVAKKDEVQAYADALLADWQQQLPLLSGRTISSVFFGGGTPSLAPPNAIAAIIQRVKQDTGLLNGAEITLEANPGTVDEAHFEGYRAAGVNRLSLGVQSFDADSLKRIGRIHDDRQAHRAIELARRLGFNNINIDLMVGLPGQTLALALRDIEIALSYSPEHVSHYQLTLEPNTPFYARPPKHLPDDDAADAMQQAGHDALRTAGYDRYEVSAWRKSAMLASRHNLNYWQFGDYVGIGAGAHGKLSFQDGRIVRTVRPKSPGSYLSAMQVAEGLIQNEITLENRPFDFLMNALRLREGVSSDLFTARTGLALTVLKEEWQCGVQDDLLQPVNGRLATTDVGYRYLNGVLSRWL